ncbi:MarR family winged helix-turn-helix transcriptional regulator [Altericroceibacterium xinjiangense]|uniref:MarR family winged helix-turn-helix transcriptional regulator n=1 Tax=Altericroceibacterium xinjiangense TaxID=762261 RepID=UPI0013DE8ACB|nr:MarR family transcriptional regulator [Altericroceibacterium xinjiangense]
MDTRTSAILPGHTLEAGSTFPIYRDGGTTPEIQFTVSLVLVARRWRALLDERLRHIAQSSARMEAMAAIINAPLSAQVDIARRLRIEGPTLTRMLATLEADGLVERLADPGDRRAKQLRITPSGEQALEEIFGIVEELRARLLEGVPPEMIEVLNSSLSGLLERLDAGLPDEAEQG